MKRESFNSGITLIALVVTIIILLILAGISINMLTGQSGILTRARQAKELTAESSQLEDTEMALTNIEMAYNTQNTIKDRKTYYENELKSYTTPAGAKIKYENGYITYNGQNNENSLMKYDIETGKIEKIGLNVNIQEYYSQHPEYHIPKGFRYLTGSVSTGYVITDAAPSETNGNEFVWIPVASEKDYVKKLGSKNGYMINAVGDGEETAAVIGDISNAVQGDILGTNKILGTSVESGLSSEAPEAKIVNAAGGFWVGRYEVGVTQNTEISTTDGITEIYEKSGLQPYRNVSQTMALTLANNWKGSNNNTDSNVEYQAGLITGTQWDVMCDFIGWDIADNNCITWGNYMNSLSDKHTGYRSEADYSWNECTDYEKNASTISVFPTGKFINKISGNFTVQKNIFDVAGNVWEWTTEVPTYGGGNNRVRRGGSAADDGSVYLASYRNGHHSAGYSRWHTGFRLVLYVK